MSIAHDHFKYPTANRKDLMSLQVIGEGDEKRRKFKGGLNTSRDYSYSLFNVDIESKAKSLFRELSKDFRSA